MKKIKSIEGPAGVAVQRVRPEPPADCEAPNDVLWVLRDSLGPRPVGGTIKGNRIFQS